MEDKFVHHKKVMTRAEFNELREKLVAGDENYGMTMIPLQNGMVEARWVTKIVTCEGCGE